MNCDENEINMNITGKNIKKFRIDKGYSLRDVVTELEKMNIGSDPSNLAKIEKGERTVSDILLFYLSKILNHDINEFFK